MQRKFSNRAREIWDKVPDKIKILNSVWCINCQKRTTIKNYLGKVRASDLVLEGQCIRCNKLVTKLIRDS